MNLYNFIFIFYYFLVFNIFRININCFTCCLGEKNDDKYVEINLQNPSKKDKSIKLRKFLNNNKLNEKTNVNINNDKDQSKDRKDTLKKEDEIIKKLEDVFLKNSFWVQINEIEIEKINACCDVLPNDLFIYYDGSNKIVVSKNEENLKEYFKEKNKDKGNIDSEKLVFNGLTRLDLPNDHFCLSNLKEKLLGVNNDDCESILYIIFKVGKKDDFFTSNIKFDMNIYYKKKDKKS